MVFKNYLLICLLSFFKIFYPLLWVHGPLHLVNISFTNIFRLERVLKVTWSTIDEISQVHLT